MHGFRGLDVDVILESGFGGGFEDVTYVAGRLRVLLDTKSTGSFLIVSANALLSSFAF